MSSVRTLVFLFRYFIISSFSLSFVFLFYLCLLFFLFGLSLFILPWPYQVHCKLLVGFRERIILV